MMNEPFEGCGKHSGFLACSCQTKRDLFDTVSSLPNFNWKREVSEVRSSMHYPLCVSRAEGERFREGPVRWDLESMDKTSSSHRPK